MWPRASNSLPSTAIKMAVPSIISSLTSLVLMTLIFPALLTKTDQDYAFFNITSFITIPNTEWNMRNTKQVTFRTCSDSGSLISMRGSLAQLSSSSSSSPQTSPVSSLNPPELVLSLFNNSVKFVWSINGQSSTVYAGSNINNNRWYTVRLKYLLGSLDLSILQDSNNVLDTVVIANSTLNSFLLDVRLSGNLTVGEGFSGCIYQGPGVSFDSVNKVTQGILWDYCPLATQQGCTSVDQDIDDCWSNPCVHGSCVDRLNSYECICPPNYNGTNCENDLAGLYGCAIEPCQHGGTCIPQEETDQNPRKFKCNCAEGYTGVICESTLDVCRTAPCQHGTCISGLSTYTCNCTGTGYTGVNCSQDVNECANETICGGPKCYNHPGGYTCACPDGYDGNPCQEVNECLSQPCKNGGQCTDGIATFSCQCATGYTGETCEDNIDDCANSPCTEPNSKCVDLLNDYECVCQDGFSVQSGSAFCQDIDECNQGFCQNSTSCQNSPGDYKCSCLPGYTGKNCSIDIDECVPDPCQNNASCKDFINRYECTCLPGFSGRNCETNIDDCVGHRCVNGASCVDLVTNYKCNCMAGWTGLYCEADINECEPNPCLNKGKCNNYQNFYNCTCDTGYTGANCGINIDDCKPDPCLNDGQCFDGVNDYSCNCTSQWMGKNCSEVFDACFSVPCLNGGTCSTQPPQQDYTCVCPLGFTGSNCEININDCVNNNCASFQKCYDAVNSFTCGCPIGFTGATCETEINECEGHPCKNNGTCTDGPGNYTCTCKQEEIDLSEFIGPNGVFLTGYTGTNCEIDINECDYDNPSICQEGGLCKNEPRGSFTCYCESGGENFNTGNFCEQKRSYCDIRLPNQMCQHGGSCKNLISGSECVCLPGFSGEFCEIDIDECLSKPCQYGGTCLDRVNDYECICIDGITGKNCETNIDDCEPDPCLNNGQCLDGINSYTCNCTDTGFTGNQCQDNIDDCVGSPCQHNGTCIDAVKAYNCNCQAGYTGQNCETDIAECSPSPCQYESRCLEYSNQSLYDKGDPNFQNFSYATAAGYLCVCVGGVKGVNCSELIDECEPKPCLNGATCIDQFNKYLCQCAAGYEGDNCQDEINECQVLKPCKNDGICHDRIADYDCTCKPPTIQGPNYGGKNCTTYMTGCEGHGQCRNGDCLPKYDSSLANPHTFDCLCHPGYTGQFCDSRTDVSFSTLDNEESNTEDYIMKQMDSSEFDLSLRFRTTLSNAVLVLGKISSETYVAVELKDGQVQVKYHSSDDTTKTWRLDTLTMVNNSEYHLLQVTLTNNITVSLPSERCTSDNGSDTQRCQLSQPYTNTQDIVNWMYIGSVSVSSFPKQNFARNYAGCMEDIVLNNDWLYLGRQIGEYYHLKPGCARVEQCVSTACNGNGFCDDLWDTFQCHCYRPYYGAKCEQEYQSATFGLHSESFAKYKFPSSRPDYTDFSFFITTRQDNGFILYIGNDQISFVTIHTFLSLYVTDGHLSGDFYKCGYVAQINKAAYISDGQKHFVEVAIRNTSLTVTMDSEIIYENLAVDSSQDRCETGWSFGVATLSLGQTISANTRDKREADRLLGTTRPERSEAALHRYRRQMANDMTSLLAKARQMSGFEGVLQDVQLDAKKLKFDDESQPGFQSPTTANVTIGANSTRLVCQDSPCENGGTCTDKFYNDFECECVRGYRGKNCSEPDFCSYGSCPPESTCSNLQNGYECISTAAFTTDQSMITYFINGTTPAPVVTFDFRTRGLYGLIFLIRQGNYFFKVRTADGNLEVNYKLSSEFSQTVAMKNPVHVNDGKWHSAKFEIINGTHVKLEITDNKGVLHETDVVSFDTGNISIEDMLKNGEIILGNTDRIKYSQHWEASFKGCLREVRMGGVLLPFFADDTFENNTAPVRFIADQIDDITHHCKGKDVCSSHACVNGGTCQDEWNAYKCRCPLGFQGSFCAENPDNCVLDPCFNEGHCIDGLDTFTCVCPKGYDGDKCQNDIDMCSATNAAMCENNASCMDRGYDFMCNCTDNRFTGWYCNTTSLQSCSNGLCQNGGTCSDVNITVGADSNVSSFSCKCSSGYEGPLCEKQKDYCSINGVVCLNNGQCVNQPLTENYSCICDPSKDFQGANCSEPIDNCQGVNCNNGNCVDGVRNFSCDCETGFEGPLCDTPIDNCQNSSYCQHGSCSNGVCNCIGSGWEGDHCEIEVNECEQTVPICRNDGNCTNLEGSFNCSCTLGYKGITCEIPSCDEGQCQNGATCQTNATNWWCECPDFIEGRVCEDIGACYYGYCDASNTINCEQSIDFGNYTCNCRDGWRGQNCTEDINECNETDPSLRHKCVNGSCLNNPGSYTCVCVPGFTGPFCALDINECDSTPCKNGGQCSNELNNFTCDCTGTGYEGRMCEDDVNECSDQSICNEGKCNNVPGNYNCDCGEMYLGSHCEHRNPCYNNTNCLNDAVCVVNITENGGYADHCDCTQGYEGPTCAKSLKSGDDDDTDLGVIIGPIVAGVVFIIVMIVIIAFVMTARSKRATRGAYSPSQQETSGSRVELGNVLKKPPEERLI